MPYNPSQNYVGGQLLASGLENFGKGIGGGISTAFTEAQKAKEEQSANQLIIDYAVKNNLITPEQHTQYLNGSASTKNGVVAGLTRTLAMDMQRKEQDRLQQNADIQRQKLPYELRSSVANANYDTARAAKEMAETGVAGAGGGAPITTPLTVNGKEIPGLYYVYRPGSKAGQVVQTAPGNDLNIQTEPGTGVQYYMKPKGEPVILSPQQQAAGRMNKMMEQAQQGGGVKASPTPQAQAPAQKQLSALDKQAASWALANPNDPRAAAILKRLGL